jgi:NADH-quinone oxidoreductase subunit I
VFKLLKEVLTNIGKKPITIEYPKVRTPVTPDQRGRHYADLSKCIGCSLCFIDCPSNAIKMEKLPQKVPKNPRGIYPVVDYGKCIFCYQCVFVCPVKAYVTSNEFELAGSELGTSREFSLATLPKEAEKKEV